MNFIPASTRALIIAQSINGLAASITFRRQDGTPLAAQTLRVEHETAYRELESGAGRGVARRLSLHGYYNHPSIADTDIQKGYRFVYDEREYTVQDPVHYPGEVQAYAEAVG